MAAEQADSAPDEDLRPAATRRDHQALFERIARYDVSSPEWSLRDAGPPSPRAAVLVALVSRGLGGGGGGCCASFRDGESDRCPGDYDVLMTLRAEHLRRSGGEVSLPGGRIDATDRDAQDAALREAEEEVGLRRADVQVIGVLPAMATFDGLVVTPVVALLRDGFAVAPNPSEVSAIFYLPLKRFLSQQGHRSLRGPRASLYIHYFDDQVDGRMYTTWGLTAHFLLVVAAIVCDLRPEVWCESTVSIASRVEPDVYAAFRVLAPAVSSTTEAISAATTTAISSVNSRLYRHRHHSPTITARLRLLSRQIC